MTEYREHGLYIVKDEYFRRFPNCTWTGNKSNKRPFYYAIKDAKGIMWLIPLSSQVDNIREKIKRDEEKHGKGNCLYYEIGLIAGKERGFKISDMFPITERYIERSFDMNNMPYIVQTGSLTESVDRKARRYLSMIEKGVIKSTRDIISIKYMLLSD